MISLKSKLVSSHTPFRIRTRGSDKVFFIHLLLDGNGESLSKTDWQLIDAIFDLGIYKAIEKLRTNKKKECKI